MASSSTLRGHAKSLHKRGLITDKQHDRMMAKIEAMAPPPAPAPVAAPDPQASAAVAPASAAQIPATVFVPGDPNAMGDPTKPQQPPAA